MAVAWSAVRDDTARTHRPKRLRCRRAPSGSRTVQQHGRAWVERGQAFQRLELARHQRVALALGHDDRAGNDVGARKGGGAPFPSPRAGVRGGRVEHVRDAEQIEEHGLLATEERHGDVEVVAERVETAGVRRVEDVAPRISGLKPASVSRPWRRTASSGIPGSTAPRSSSAMRVAARRSSGRATPRATPPIVASGAVSTCGPTTAPVSSASAATTRSPPAAALTAPRALVAPMIAAPPATIATVRKCTPSARVATRSASAIMQAAPAVTRRRRAGARASASPTECDQEGGRQAEEHECARRNAKVGESRQTLERRRDTARRTEPEEDEHRGDRAVEPHEAPKLVPTRPREQSDQHERQRGAAEIVVRLPVDVRAARRSDPRRRRRTSPVPGSRLPRSPPD